MRKLLGLILPAAAALSVAACGAGNKDASATTYVITTPGGATNGAAASTPSHVAAPAAGPATRQRGHGSPQTPHPQAPRGRRVRYSQKVTGPTPALCLREAGLLNPHTVNPGEASARSATVGADVFVDGPYRNAGQAASSAASLQGVETVQAARLYVVSTLRTAHLGAVVRKVAGCLKGAKGSGFLTF